MTDNGLAALATAIHVGRNHQHDPRADERPHAHLISEREQEEAAAILRNGAVFLPEGLGPVMVGMAKEIAALRVALGLLVGDIRDVGPDEPPQRMIPAQHRVSDIRQARLALAIVDPEETDHD